MQGYILNHYKKLMPFLSSLLGPDYEISLYDISGHESSLVAIYNSKHKNVQIGQPLDNCERHLILQKSYLEKDSEMHYTCIDEAGVTMRSSAFFMKNDEGEVEGLFLAKFDSSRFQDMSKKILELCHPDDYIAKNITVNFDAMCDSSAYELISDDVTMALSAATEDIFSVVLENTAVPVEYLTNLEKQDIVRLLQEKGVFYMKGAIPHVADKLHCSTATIYRYLSKIKRDDIG